MKTKPVPTSMFLVVEQLKLHVETSKKAQFTTFNVRHKNIRTASKPCHFRLQKNRGFSSVQFRVLTAVPVSVTVTTLAVYLLSAFVSLVFMVLYFTFQRAEPGGFGPWPHWLTIVLQCYDTWLGHLTHKIVPEMTCNVSSGTLNPTIPLPMLLDAVVCLGQYCVVFDGCWKPSRIRELNMSVKLASR